MIIREMPESERPREKLMQHGSASLANRELIAILLGSGTKEKSALKIADELLVLRGSGLRDLCYLTAADLSKIKGIGTAKASVLLAAIELGKRLAAETKTNVRRISEISDVLDICMQRMRYYKKEYFNALLLNSKGEIISEENISVGDLSGSIVHPREAFFEAVNRSAAAVIFVHNHPSGDPAPSSEDIAVTRRLCEAGNILGIKVFDHVIIGDGLHVSLKAEGYIEE